MPNTVVDNNSKTSQRENTILLRSTIKHENGDYTIVLNSR